MAFGDILGSLTGSTAASTPSAKSPAQLGAADMVALLFQQPALLQGLQLAAFLGEDISQFFVTDKKKLKAAAKKGDTSILGLGKNFGINAFALASAIPELQQKAFTKQTGLFQGAVEEVSALPQFKQTADFAAGEFGAFGEKVQNIANIGLARSLGAAAPGGFITDPIRQSQLSLQTAQPLAQFLQGLQTASQAKLEGLAGGGVLATQAPGVQGAIPSQQSQIPGILNVASLGQANQQFNAQLGFEQAAFQSQQTSSLIGSLLGTGFGGGFGGGGGAAGGGGIFV